MKRLHSVGSLTEEYSSEQDDAQSLRTSWSLVSERNKLCRVFKEFLGTSDLEWCKTRGLHYEERLLVNLGNFGSNRTLY